MMKRIVGRRCRQRGVAAIEFAILFIFVMIPITFGITELGRAFHQYNTVAKNVRDGARYLSTQTPGSTLAGRCLALTGSSATSGSGCSGTPLLPGLTLAQITTCDASTCPTTHQFQATGGGVVNLVTITITGYPFSSMFPFVIPDITFGPIQATMVQPV